ncbi:hypothetical protein POM88_021916 [Heracleum sosnowskyi]|uniref:Uncharacterized protein n=1 Tax=Heracleum sosnowskyi TaxID=360622 RepID=A0AAD8MT00_9APIA|nr:hypothetical protein POM88_021916 [Heracleum sosnowskyi]
MVSMATLFNPISSARSETCVSAELATDPGKEVMEKRSGLKLNIGIIHPDLGIGLTETCVGTCVGTFVSLPNEQDMLGGAVPALAQLASSSYHAVVSSPSLPPPSPQDDNINKSRTSSTL